MGLIQHGKDKVLQIQLSTTHRKVNEHTEATSSQQYIRCARAKDTRYSLKQGLRLHTRQSIFTIETIKPQGRLPRQAVQSPTLEIFKNSLGTALSNLL